MIYQKTKSLIPHSIANRVLTVGPDHINYRGGIGGVMNVYAEHFTKYKYITSHKSNLNKWSSIPFFITQYIRFIQVLLSDTTVQIIHLQGSFKGSFYRKFIFFFIAKYGFGKKVLYHMHGSKFDVFYYNSDLITKRLIRFLAERADIVVCLSNYWYTFFSQNFRTCRLEILPNVINQLEPLHKINFTRPTNELLQLLFLGAIGERKGIFDLLDVLRQHKHAFTGKLLLRVGGNGETERLQVYIREHELKDLVQFEGWVSGDKKHELLSTCNIYILPSYHEGLPISILEAMNYQLPIISTPVGGTAEVVHEGINGFLVQPGDKQAIADRLMRFIDQPELPQIMGKASSLIVKEYLPESVFPKLQKLYESLLES